MFIILVLTGPNHCTTK